MCGEMGAIVKQFLKLFILPAAFFMLSCKKSPYIADNKKRAKHLSSLRDKYDEPGEARVKTGNPEDGF